jgi:hypothetical protein
LIPEISALIAILAALISTVQVLVTRTSSRGDILSQTMRHHWAPENRAKRDIVLGLDGKPFDEWSQSETDAAVSVAIQISQLGFLLRHSYADRNAFLDFWATWCIRTYKILVPLIANRRIEQGAPDQWIYFEWLARRAALHMERAPWWERRSWIRLKRRTNSLTDPNELPPAESDDSDDPA